jgi:hypothetical protein
MPRSALAVPQPSTEEITVASRFCGPPEMANGGYVAGLAAAGIAGPVEVTLRRPVPLDRPLVLEPGEPTVLRDGDTVLLEARPAPLRLDVPSSPSFVRAHRMACRFAGFERHPFPRCFVCGPERAAGDGLRIFAGGEPGSDAVAAPWMPDPSLAGDDGRVRPEFLWAALDCPGYFAIARDGETAVLGRITATVDATIAADEPCVVIGWAVGRDGRKLHAGTALFDADGVCRGRSLQTWLVR